MCWYDTSKLVGWFHSAVAREVGQTKSLHELVDVDAAVLVEIDAGRQVGDSLVADVDLQVGAEELPGLTKLLVGDWTLLDTKRLNMSHLKINRRWRGISGVFITLLEMQKKPTKFIKIVF